MLDYTTLPTIDYDLCTVYFPSRPISSAEPPGLLVQLTRLNVPCDNGGYIIFTNQSYLCGKLEDLSNNERTYYFPFHQDTNVVLHKSPLFSLTFKLVDYCYNMTLIERNNSILLEPKDALECYFKIHLPYGNQIELNLFVNSYTKTSNGDEIVAKYAVAGDLPEGGKGEPAAAAAAAVDTEYVDLSAGEFVTTGGRYGGDCRGMAIQIEDKETKSWTNCVHGNSPAKRFKFRSTRNSLVIRVSRSLLGVDDFGRGHLDEHPKEMATPSLYLEYNALPIADIVSQCAFGWVAVHQFCITAVENALPWSMAEAECKKLGGHLASIKSEREQRIIDSLLFNSVAFKESAAYWVGASDEIFEGDFRWSNGFPYTYSSMYLILFFTMGGLSSFNTPYFSLNILDWFPGWMEHNNYNKQPNDDGENQNQLFSVELSTVRV